MRLDARIERDGHLLTTAELHYVVIEPATKLKQPIPQHVRAALEGAAN
jgi:acyl-CoA thioesterase FadM